MKIAYILTTFPSRTELFALREIECLRALGCEITVLAANGAGNATMRTDTDSVVYRPAFLSLGSTRALVCFLWRYPLAIARLIFLAFQTLLHSPRESLTLLGNLHTIAYFARHLDDNNIRHIHAFFLSWPACIGLALSRLTGRTMSMAAHARDVFVESGAIVLKARAAKFIVTCNKEAKTRLDEVIGDVHGDKLHLIHHGINPDDLSAEKKHKVSGSMDSSEKRLILAVGRLVPKKGFLCLLEAFAHLRQEVGNCRLTIVGDGPERSVLQGAIGSLELGEHVELSGWASNTRVIELMHSATVLVVPSIVDANGDRDGLPNVILEAGICRLPVIASRLSGIMEVIAHEETGILVDPGDVSQLAEAMDRLLSDDQMSNSIVLQAERRVSQQYDLRTNVRQLLELFSTSVV